MPVAKVMEWLCALGMLSVTPSEVVKDGGWALAVMPPPAFVPMYNEPGEDTRLYRIATPGESRRNKRKGIEDAEEIDVTKTEN